MVAQRLPQTQARMCIPGRRKEERRHQLHFFLLPAKTKAFTIDSEYTDKAQVAVFFKSSPGKDSLAVQWLGLQAFTAEGSGLSPGGGTKILQAMLCSQKANKPKNKSSPGNYAAEVRTSAYIDHYLSAMAGPVNALNEARVLQGVGNRFG